MTDRLICPSLMCANFSDIASEIQSLDEAGVDIYHMDVMDGSFVSNLALGREDYETVRKLTTKPMDVHLMVQNPISFVDLFASLGADIIYIHVEADQQPARTVERIRDFRLHPGIAINPDTSFDTVKELLPLVDYVLVMTVVPGDSGKPYQDYVTGKIETLVKNKKQFGYKLMVDGAISPDKIQKLSKLGVDGFIVGTSSLFGKGRSYKSIVAELKGDKTNA